MHYNLSSSKNVVQNCIKGSLELNDRWRKVLDYYSAAEMFSVEKQRMIKDNDDERGQNGK